MSEENIPKDSESIEKALSTQNSQGDDTIQLKINRSKNELSFVNPVTGKAITIKAIIEDDDEDEEDEEDSEERPAPLPPDEFRDVLKQLDDLGITWSAGVPPTPRFKKGFEKSQTFGEEYFQIQKKYPRFPRELGAVIMNALAGTNQPEALIGNEEDVKKKVEIIHEVLITPEYRSEFFFRHAIKVPYFEEADWEVVIKAYERDVKEMPKSAYALLSLAFRNPVDSTLPIEEGSMEYVRPQFVTAAVNEYLLDKLITQLTAARAALEKAQQAVRLLNDQTESSEENTDE